MEHPDRISGLLRTVPPTGEVGVAALARVLALPESPSAAAVTLRGTETLGRARDPVLEPYTASVPPLEAVVTNGRDLIRNLLGYRGLYRCIPKVCTRVMYGVRLWCAGATGC